MEKDFNNLPFVSVVMPVRNEADFIGRSLGAVLAQNYPPENLEIIVADGFSIDETREIINEISANSNVRITLLDNPEHIAPTGLNRAIKAAQGEIIVRVDGHCEIAPDYVMNCVRHLHSNRYAAVGGPIETVGATRTARAIAVAMSSKFGVGGSAFRCISDREMETDTVAFPAFDREIFNRVGLFNEELVRNQDDEFSYRLRKSGGKILLAPDIRSRYYSRGNLKSLWRQYFQYGYWKVRVLQLHPRQMSLRQFVPFAFVVILASLALFAVFSIYGRWALIFTLGLYLLAAAAATLQAARRIEFAALPLMPPIFFILHFSYGLGFLKGLFAFRKNWRSAESNLAAKTTV